MKFAFPDKYFNSTSFVDLCNIAQNYGFDGIEITDANKEKESHADSIFCSSVTADAKRKLVNRHIAIPVVCCTEKITDKAICQSLIDSIDYCLIANVDGVVIQIDEYKSIENLKKFLFPAIQRAETSGVNILIETCGALANTQQVLDIINELGSATIKVCWNIRETFFIANELADKTIQTLGAYINYVRIGDKKDGKNTLIGEGELPVQDFMNALRSLNYDGYVSVMDCDETNSADILLTHFISYMSSKTVEKKQKTLYYNRSKTGTHPWKKFDVLDVTFSEVLDTMVQYYPDQYAFKYTTLDYTRTYKEFRDDVDRTAAALISLGVEPGHHVAIWATNIPQWFITFWATVKIGAVLVTVNTAYKIHEAEYLLRQSDTHTLVMIDSCKDSNYKEIIEELCPELKNTMKGQPLYSKKLPFLRNVVTVGFDMDGCLEWNDFVARSKSVPQEEVRRRASNVKVDDVCNMQYTSGTTGFPKGVMLTHRNIVNNGKIIGDRMDISTADRMMVQVPMFHCFGMVLSMTNIMTHGGTLCPMPYFSPKSSLACVNDEKITCFNGVPTMFIAMFGHADFAKTDFSHIRTGIMAGANCPADLMRKAAKEMNMTEIISVYGQTEASPGCTMGEVNEDIDHRVETVGSAFPGV